VAVGIVLLSALASAPVAAARRQHDSDPIGVTGPALVASVSGAPSGDPTPPGFLGVSMEYFAAHRYTGLDPNAVNPVLVQLLRSLTTGRQGVIRIGGNSADWTWWPAGGRFPPDGIRYSLSRNWLLSTRALAQQTGDKLILGLNLAAGRPSLAAAEARAFTQVIGRQNIEAFEIGNEPDLYGKLSWYYTPHNRPIFSRPATYSLLQFTQEFQTWRGVTGQVPVAGPAFAGPAWMSGLDGFLGAEPGLALATFHRYPLRGCSVAQSDPSYATESNLLSDYATTQLTAAVAPFAAVAHAHDLPFRVDEMNSVACSGRTGVSDTYGSALWMLDALFGMRAAGVDGVNVHTLPGSAYELFTFTDGADGWRGFVHPDYYGMLMFEQADPPGARLLPVSGSGGQVKLWATEAPDGTKRIVVINKDPVNAHVVLVSPPGKAGVATVELLRARGVTATSGVTLGGQTFGNATATGVLPGPPRTVSIGPVAGLYWLTVPPATAELLTTR
jgi:hypothetical protein